ncbi:MAG: flavodoxin family protein [Acidimicrobiia bacterium]
MKAVVLYESIYGNTRAVAQAIGEGLSGAYDVVVLAVDDAPPLGMADLDLLVVGGPTHVHGMSRPASRQAATDAARKPGSGLVLEEAADGPGVREWLDALGALPTNTAAFDTRIKAPAMLTGQASHGISKAMLRHGATEVVPPESFFVTKDNRLVDGEIDRARQWGARVAASAPASRRA